MSLFSFLGNNADWLGPAIGLGGALLSGDQSQAGGPQSSNSNTTVNTPWSGAMPTLNNAMGQVNSLYNSDVGTEYYPGQTYTPMGWDTSTALNQMRDRAMNGSELNNDAQSSLQDIINGGSNPNADYSQFMNNNAPGNDLYNQATSGGSGYNPSTSSGNFNQYMSGTNPHLDAMVDKSMNKVGDQVNSLFSKAGRYGSEAHQDTFTEGLGDVANSMYGAQYNNDRNRGLSAANSVSGIEQQDLSRQANQFNQQNSNLMQAGNAINNQYNTGQNTALNATNSQNSYGQNDLSRRLQAIGMAPGMAQNDYADAGKLLGIGEVVEGYQNRENQDQMARWNFNQQQPFNRVNNYANLATQFGGMGGTTTGNGTQTAPGNTWQQNAGNWLQLGQDVGGMFGGFGNNLTNNADWSNGSWANF